MNWGKWIVVSFIAFAAFIATLVTVCMRQDVNLVSKDYYQEELVYQDQITRLKNTAALPTKPSITLDNRGIQIQFESFPKIEKGELVLFCPANPRNDRKISIEASAAGTQTIPLDDLQPGMYHAKFSWSMDGTDFYVDNVVSL